jgi:hypothetical protein
MLDVPDRLPFLHNGERRILLVNRTAEIASTELPGSVGGTLCIVDTESAGGEVRRSAVKSETVELGPFAVACVRFPKT